MYGLIIKLLMRYPKIVLIICMFGFLGFGALAAFYFEQVSRTPSVPVPIDLELGKILVTSGNEVPVSIYSVEWDCRNIIREEDSSYIKDILFSDKQKSFLGIATFSSLDYMTCDTLPQENITGILAPLSATAPQDMEAFGLNVDAYNLENRGMALCTYCGYKNNLTGLILCGTFSILCIAMYPLFLKIREGRIKNEFYPEWVFPEDFEDDHYFDDFEEYDRMEF